MRWLCSEYKRSAAFKGLNPSTKRARGRILDRFCEEHGDKPYSRLERTQLLKIRDKIAETPAAANELIKVVRQVFKFAMEYFDHDSNPARDINYLPSNNPEGFHAWTLDEVEQFEERHPIGTKARLAIGLMMYGGCARSSDVSQLGRQNLKEGGRLRYTQFKGRQRSPVKIDIPVIDELATILEASPVGEMTFLVTQFGHPFASSKAFGNWFKKRCVEAGLPHCSAHGVRKAAAARMAEIGLSDFEIMAIGGWKTLKEVQRYTRSARRRVMADSGMEKVETDIERTKVSNQRGGGK